MELNKVKYPLGIQTFSEIIEEGYLYVDKTEYVYKMTHPGKYVFLSRPRRFGKSLLVSTLQSYFEGRKELFKGLAIEEMETEWRQYPVVSLSLASAKGLEKDALERTLHDLLEKNEQHFGVQQDGIDLNTRFKNLILNISKKTGEKVVVLIDEYDAPLLDVVVKGDELEKVRNMMRSLYSPLKDLGPYLRFTFITGITKFSQLSIFSELNNLNNISMLEDYAGVCGITEEEMLTQMQPGIENLAVKLGKTKEETIAELKSNYDGYHFCWPSPDVYNPFSLLNAISNKKIKSYWFGSGTPSYLVALFKKFGVTPQQLGEKMTAIEDDFDTPTESMTDIVPILYQSGYITISDFDDDSQNYTLDIPNNEIRTGLFRNLLPNYVGLSVRNANTTIGQMQTALRKDDIDSMLTFLQTFLDTIPGADNVDKPEHFEAHWQRMLFVIFTLLGATCDVEVKTPKGRVDLVARTANKLYLMELKMNKTAEKAMSQINLKEYDKRFALCSLPVVKVGISFDRKKKNITGWKIETK